MYTPSHFHSDDIKAMHAAIRRHPFGLLITLFQGELNLTHLPFHLDATRGPHGTLEAHLARLNPHCAALQAGAASTVVFKGPDAYVSPRWYLDPAKNVPTWNYVAIHAHGVPKPLQTRRPCSSSSAPSRMNTRPISNSPGASARQSPMPSGSRATSWVSNWR